jgi:hypothetical protein
VGKAEPLGKLGTIGVQTESAGEALGGAEPGCQESLSDSFALAAIFSGEREEIERPCDEHQLSLALAQENDEIFTLYKLRATPSGVLVDSGGTIASLLPAEGVPAIEALVRAAASRDAPARLVVRSG